MIADYSRIPDILPRMEEKIDERSRLLFEACEQGAWNESPEEIVARVNRLALGLPAEDEFIAICSWLGQCRLIHKLDQAPSPSSSGRHYQVPDLFAEFIVNGKSVTVLIEVKMKKCNSLSFTPKYRKKLQAYSQLVGHPILIAWKIHGLWILVELSHFKKADTNFNLSWKVALKESLMGILAGDYSITLHRGAGVHFKFRKQNLVDSVVEENGDRQEKWHSIIEEVFVTKVTGERCQLEGNAGALFHVADLTQQTKDLENHLETSFVIDEMNGLFAQMVLARLIRNRRPDDLLHWREQLPDVKGIDTGVDFRKSVDDALACGIVHIVGLLQPQTSASFLKLEQSSS